MDEGGLCLKGLWVLMLRDFYHQRFPAHSVRLAAAFTWSPSLGYVRIAVKDKARYTILCLRSVYLVGYNVSITFQLNRASCKSFLRS